MAPARMPKEDVVSWKAAAGAGFGEFVEVAFTHFFGVAGGVVVPGFLFGGGEDAFFGTADALVGVHAFEQELGGADGDFRGGLGADLEVFRKRPWICRSSNT